MSNKISAEATTNLTLTDVSQPIRDLVMRGKPLSLARKIMDAKDDAQRIDLLTGAVHACAIALGTRNITETKANLRMRQISALDGSKDNDDLLEALRKLEESNPPECKAVISSLSATTILSLAQPDTMLAAFIVEKTTAERLASVANSIAGRVFISERRQREKEKRNLWEEDKRPHNIDDDPELNHFRQKAVRRELGQFFDLVKEAGDESLENFALAIAKYLHEPDGFSPLFDTICRLALEDGRESAIDLIQVLPETPKITRIKVKLGLE